MPSPVLPPALGIRACVASSVIGRRRTAGWVGSSLMRGGAGSGASFSASAARAGRVDRSETVRGPPDEAVGPASAAGFDEASGDGLVTADSWATVRMAPRSASAGRPDSALSSGLSDGASCGLGVGGTTTGATAGIGGGTGMAGRDGSRMTARSSPARVVSCCRRAGRWICTAVGADDSAAGTAGIAPLWNGEFAACTATGPDAETAAGGNNTTGAGSRAGDVPRARCGTASSVETSSRGRVGTSAGPLAEVGDRAPPASSAKAGVAATSVGGSGGLAVGDGTLLGSGSSSAGGGGTIGAVVGCCRSAAASIAVFPDRAEAGSGETAAVGAGGRRTGDAELGGNPSDGTWAGTRLDAGSAAEVGVAGTDVDSAATGTGAAAADSMGAGFACAASAGGAVSAEAGRAGACGAARSASRGRAALGSVGTVSGAAGSGAGREAGSTSAEPARARTGVTADGAGTGSAGARALAVGAATTTS